MTGQEAWMKFITSDAGKKLLLTTILRGTEDLHYLENHLRAAFIAGCDIGAKVATERIINAINNTPI